MKVKMACYLLLNVLLHLTTYGRQQQQKQQQQQDVTPVSPEAAALAKMVNYPVNLNTGVPDISIPLYTIETGGMALPVTLQYHAGGFNINEHSTRAGLGWSLSCDLQITRTVNGLDDFDYRGYLQNSDIKSHNPANNATYYPLGPANWQHAYRFSAGELDGMPDKYYYKLLNKSGSFYFRKNDAGTGYTIAPVPYDNIQITFANHVFTIIDTDGTTYIFGASGNTPDGSLAPVYRESSGTAFTTWKCRYVTNPTNTETISFTYQDKPTETFGSWNESIEYYTKPSAPSCLDAYVTQPQVEAAHPGSYSYEQLLIFYPFHRLSSPKYIENFPDKQPVFHLPYVQHDGNGNRVIQDKTFPITSGSNNSSGAAVHGIALSKIEFNGGSVEFTGTDRLTSIQVKSIDQSVLRSFAFYHSVTGNLIPGNRPTLYLDSLHAINNSGEAIERYYLLYKNKLPFGSILVGKDAWGFANAFTNYWGNEYDFTAPGSSIPNQQITHPFYFNCQTSDPNVTFSIGNTINTELVDQEGSQRGILKRIVYPTGGYADFDFESNKYKEPSTVNTMCIQMSGGLRIRAITYYDGKSLLPASQKHYRYGEFEDGLGLVVDAPPKTFDGTAFKYNAYSYQQDVAYVQSRAGINPACASGNDATPSCLSLEFKEVKTTYLPASAGNYTYPHGAPIYYTKVTEYNSDLGKETGKTVHTFYPPFHFTNNFPSKIYGTNIDYMRPDGLMGKQKLLEEYKFVNGRYALVHSKEFMYTKYSQPAQVKVIYSYNNTDVRIVSGSYSGMQEGLYNPDLGFAGNFTTGQYGIEVGTLLLSNETEKWVSEAGTLTQTVGYSYNSPYLQLSAIETTKSDGTTILRNLKHCNDFSSQPVYAQMLSRNMISQVIEEQEIGNTGSLTTSRTNYDVFHNSFIAPKSVEKSFGNGPFKTTVQYDLYDNKANLLQSTAQNGIVTSYIWGYNYKYVLAKIAGLGYAQATATIDVATLNTVTNEAQLRTTFNNLRTSHPSAFITSFTYKPLTGISSTSDPLGLTSYFQYDGAGRLSVVKDNNNQIVKTYRYNMMNRLSPAAGYLQPTLINDMESYNKTRPDNTKFIYNFTIPRGSAPYDQEGQNYVPDEKDGISEANVLIQLLGRFDPAKVSGLHLDLLKNGSLVYTKRFKASNDYTPIEFYIPHGEYQVNLRLDDNFQNVILNNHFYSPAGANQPENQFMINGPVTINFVPGITYSITSFDY
ncbi:hypothetical protein FAM09_25795 [Niastella caeni]|uniref:RHS repeat protein n=1 Tax=Niastella caeni TaxID=2569763 RepID=A0A4S8HF69_9BACT|nr:hypothetical protein [Niastella caeni]THU33563.1 hypothetical protein FAM09_25795 [Niastella caeni]